MEKQKYQEIAGDLVKLSKKGYFDVIAHCCNCFCVMGRGIAPQIAAAYPKAQEADNNTGKGDIKKLGSYSHAWDVIEGEKEAEEIAIINLYGQYHYANPSPYGIPVDYDALTLGLRKVNYMFEGLHIGVPQMGAGLAGGDWERIKGIIQRELKNMYVTVVIYNE